MATDRAAPIIDRAPLRAQVREWLTAGIFDGTYAPGERLVETRIAAELGVSQAPVREALRELETLRLVEHAPFRGARVRAPKPDELLAVFPVREALETLACRLAAPTLKKDLDRLRAPLEEMRRAARDGSAHALIANDVGFHAAIVTAAANPSLTDAWNALGVDGHAYVTITRLQLDLADVAESHVPILQAFESGSPRDASHALRAHLAGYARLARDDERSRASEASG